NNFGVDEMSKAIDYLIELGERVKTRVVRGGKVVKKLKCPPGYKSEKGKCVKMQAKETMRRKKAAKKAARTGKSKRAQASRKRARSVKKRTWSK
ncbi:MAG: hypothetical protein ACTSVK_07720, partial [Promethearchaeota archaeon]